MGVFAPKRLSPFSQACYRRGVRHIDQDQRQRNLTSATLALALTSAASAKSRGLRPSSDDPAAAIVSAPRVNHYSP